MTTEEKRTVARAIIDTILVVMIAGNFIMARESELKGELLSLSYYAMVTVLAVVRVLYQVEWAQEKKEKS